MSGLKFLIVKILAQKYWPANCASKMVSATLLGMQIKVSSCVFTVKRYIASNAFRIKLIKISTEKVTNARIVAKAKILMNYSMMIRKPIKRKYGNNSTV